MNQIVVTCDKLTNNFVSLITCGIGPDVVREPTVAYTDMKLSTLYYTIRTIDPFS
jgi:hypothetical protein